MKPEQKLNELKESETKYAMKLIYYLQSIKSMYRQREVEELSIIDEMIQTIEASLFRAKNFHMLGDFVENLYEWSFYDYNYSNIKDFKDRILNFKIDLRVLNNSNKNWKEQDLSFQDFIDHCSVLLQELDFISIAPIAACHVLNIKLKKDVSEKYSDYFRILKNRAEKYYFALNLIKYGKESDEAYILAKELIFGTKERPYSLCLFLTPFLSFPNGSYRDINREIVLKSIHQGE